MGIGKSWEECIQIKGSLDEIKMKACTLANRHKAKVEIWNQRELIMDVAHRSGGCKFTERGVRR